MKNVLIADDEKPFLKNLVRGFRDFPDNFNVWAAENGKIAMEILRDTNIDLVITDLKMPVMDGFELLSYMSRNHPSIPVIVITGIKSPEIKNKLQSLGISQFVEKPLKFEALVEKVFDKLKVCPDLADHRIDLYTFLLLVEIEKKDCTLTVRSDHKTGQLFFQKGKLINAEFDSLEGEEAACEIFGWDNPQVDMDDHCIQREKKIDHPLILIEGLRPKVEKKWKQPERRKREITATEIKEEDHLQLTVSKEQQSFEALKEVIVMAVQDKLKELSSIEGFVGVGLFTPTGESLALLAGDNKVNIKDIGVLANNVLRNAQKASLDMGTGRGQLVHVEAEHAHIIVRCLNEGNDPLKSEPGKAHIHLVLVLNSESSLGLGKLKVGSIISALAPEFRA